MEIKMWDGDKTCDYIVVHPGDAHMDDFIACCLILAKVGLTDIKRHVPDQIDEVENHRVYTVDVGAFYSPDHHAFDHHHDPDLGCSATLVAEYFSLDTSCFSWWKTMDMMDLQGPFATSKALGTTWDVVSKFQSPLHLYMLELFGAEVEHDKWCWLVKFMRSLGEDLFRRSESYNTHIENIGRLVTLINIKDLQWALVNSDNIEGLEGWIRKNDEEVAGIICHDNRGTGLSLIRRADHPRVDFRRVKQDDGVVFIHNNGFIMKMAARSLSTARRYIEQATD